MELTPEEAHRLHVLMLLETRRITPRLAAEALGLTIRQVRCLRETVRVGGPQGLTHRNRGRPGHNRLSDELRAQIAACARGRYVGLNEHHLTEKLTAVEALAISRATGRRILRAA